MVDFKFNDAGNVLTIFDCYKTSKHNYRFELQELKDAFPDKIIFERDLCSLTKEWATHAFLYDIGYKRERTKDADLDNPCDHPEWMYRIIGTLVWPFIK